MSRLPPPRLTVRRLFNDYESLQELLKIDLPLFPYGVKASDEDLPGGKERKMKRMKKLSKKTSTSAESSTTGHATPNTVPSPEKSTADLIARIETELSSKTGSESKPNRSKSATVRGGKSGKVKASRSKRRTVSVGFPVPLPTRMSEVEGPDPERFQALLFNPLPRAKTQKSKPKVESDVVDGGSQDGFTQRGRQPRRPWQTVQSFNLPDFEPGYEPEIDMGMPQGKKNFKVKADESLVSSATGISRKVSTFTGSRMKQSETDFFDEQPSKAFKILPPFAFMTVEDENSQTKIIPSHAFITAENKPSKVCKIPAPFAFMTIDDKPSKPKTPPPVESKTSTRSASSPFLGSMSLKSLTMRDKPKAETRKRSVSPWENYQEYQAKQPTITRIKPALSKFGGPIAPPRVKKPTVPYELHHLYVKRRSMILPSPTKWNTVGRKEIPSVSKAAKELAKRKSPEFIMRPSFVIHDRYFISTDEKAAVGAPIPRSRLPPSRLKSSMKPSISMSSMSVCSEYSIASGASSHASVKKAVTFVLPEEEEELRASGRILTKNELRVKWSQYNDDLGTNWREFRKEFPRCMFVRILECAPKVKIQKTMPPGPILALIPTVKMNEDLHRVPWHHNPSPFPETAASRKYGFQRKVGIMNPLDYHVPFKITEEDIVSFGVIRP